MCYHPIEIDNPNCGVNIPIIKYTKNTWSRKILVPCGKCVACRSKKQSDLLQRVQVESQNHHVFMFTLTYNNDRIPRITLPETGVELFKPNYKHLTDMFKRIRQANYFGDRHFKYIVCTEYTKKPPLYRPHYHGLLFLEKLDSDNDWTWFGLEQLVSSTLLSEWKENIATFVAKRDSKRYKAGFTYKNTRNPIWVPLCTYIQSIRNHRVRSTFDCHHVKPIAENGNNDVSFYVTKYLFKDSCGERFIRKCCYDECEVSGDDIEPMQLFRKEFRCGRRSSLNLGSKYTDESYREFRSKRDSKLLVKNKVVQDILSKNVAIARSLGDPVKFFDLYTGHSMPLSQFYVKALTQDDAIYHAHTLLKLYADTIQHVPSVHDERMKDHVHEISQNDDLFDDTSLFT